MADLVKYPAEVLQAMYKTHRHSDLDKVVSRIEQGQRRFYGEDVVLAVTLDLWDRDRLRIRLYQQERQVLRAIYVLAHQQNSIIVEFTPAQLMEVVAPPVWWGESTSPLAYDPWKSPQNVKRLPTADGVTTDSPMGLVEMPVCCSEKSPGTTCPSVVTPRNGSAKALSALV